MRFCATGLSLCISTAKPTVCTAGCELVLHNGIFLGVTVSVSWRPATVVFRKQVGYRYSATVLPNGAHFGCKGNGGLWWPGKISVRTTTDGI